MAKLMLFLIFTKESQDFCKKKILPNAYLFELFIGHVIYGIFLLSIYTVDKRPLFLFQCKNRGYVIIELSIHQSAAWD